MQIYFHSHLCSYLPRVPILVSSTVYDYASTFTIANARPQNNCTAPLDSEDGGNCFLRFCSNTVLKCRKHITTIWTKRSARVKLPPF